VRRYTLQELRAQEAFERGLRIVPRCTSTPVIIAMIGLVGSGKSVIAQQLAERVGATII